MTPPPQAKPCWTWGKLWLTAGLLFAVQAGLILIFAERSGAARPAGSGGGGFRLLSAPMADETGTPLPFSRGPLLWSLFAEDPTVFTLPGAHGFSAQSWLGTPAGPSEPAAPVQPPAFLQLDTAALGSARAGMEAQPAPPPLRTAVGQTSELDPWPAIPDPVAVRTASRLMLPSSVAQRRISPWPALSSWPAGKGQTVLTNTIVHLALNDAGQVVAARLSSRSGSPNADAQALAAARNLRFRPAPAVWADAVFEWQTAALTNTVARPLHPFP